MGKRPSRAYVPQAGSSFNIIMSIQYRGWKENQFPRLVFTSNEGVRRAMNTLQLKSDLSRLGLPDAVQPEQIYRSSYGYANTIEILFPNCEGKGVIEHRFRSINQHLQEDASELESMQIRTLYIYFLQKHIVKLDENSPSTFVFRRPLTGWPRHPSSLHRARTPPRMPRAWHRTPSPSSLRDPVHDTSAPDENLSGQTDTMAQPVATSSPRRSINQVDETANDLDIKKRRPSAHSRCSEDSTSGPVKFVSTNFTPIPSATQPVMENTVEMVRHAPPVLSQADQEADPHRDEREALRKQIEQCETQRQLQQKRIRELQQELSAERDARQQAEVRLEEERGMLERERRKLREMRRECSEPFVTPSLLDAFQEVSAIARAI